MADMGFLPAVRRLLDQTSLDRQTLLFSATLDGDVAVSPATTRPTRSRHEVAGVETDAADADHRFERVDGRGAHRPRRRGHRRRGSDDRVLPHPSRCRQDRQEARRRPACRRHRSTVACRRPSATARSPRSRKGNVHALDRDRRRRPRHPRRRRRVRGALRPARGRQDLRAPLRPHRPQGRDRAWWCRSCCPTRCVRVSGSSASSASRPRARPATARTAPTARASDRDGRRAAVLAQPPGPPSLDADVGRRTHI